MTVVFFHTPACICIQSRPGPKLRPESKAAWSEGSTIKGQGLPLVTFGSWSAMGDLISGFLLEGGRGVNALKPNISKEKERGSPG